MCDLNLRLVAWIDGELPEDEGATIERHVQSCAECRHRVAAYKAASSDFAGYYSAATQPAPETQSPRKMPRWVPFAIAAAAAVVVALLLLPRAQKQAAPPLQAAKVTTQLHRSQRLNRWSKPSPYPWLRSDARSPPQPSSARGLGHRTARDPNRNPRRLGVSSGSRS